MASVPFRIPIASPRPAAYDNAFAFSLAAGQRVYLDFGAGTPTAQTDKHARFIAGIESPVREVAQVYVNDKLAGWVWKPPYRAEVTGLLTKGTNHLRVVVYNTAMNEMAGRALPDYRLSTTVMAALCAAGYGGYQAIALGIAGAGAFALARKSIESLYILCVTGALMNEIRRRLLLATIVIAVAAPLASAQNKYFSTWPEGYSPQEVGKRVAEHFVTSPHQDPQKIVYPEVCTWYGALTFARLSSDQPLLDEMVKRFEPLMSPPGSALIHRERHVDYEMFGALPLEIYMETKDPKYRELGKSFADLQWEPVPPDVHVREGMPPQELAAGLTPETRFWIDDMYMITILQVQAYRATGDMKYLNRASLEMVAYLDKLQQPNGLFYHAPDVPFFWGRGDGWIAAGMAELLRSLPANHPRRKRILEGYRTMMKALLEYQGADGMWRQLIDHPEAWPETSSSGMFTFAMITGVRNGWLDEETYGPAARKAWIALVGYVDQNADVTNVCIGTGKKNDLEYYLMRPRHTGDMHGQAPILWSASALLEPAGH